MTETGAHVSEVCGSVYRLMPVAGFLKGHENSLAAGCSEAGVPVSPPMADSVRARRSGTDEEHVRREREAIITGTGEGDLLRHRSLFSGGWYPQCRRHGSRDVSLGEVTSCVEGRSPGEVASMVEEGSPGGKFRLVEAFFPNKRVLCGPAGHADNLCVRPQSFVRGTQNATNGDVGDSVVMASGELISGPVRLQESAVMLSGTAGLSTDL